MSYQSNHHRTAATTHQPLDDSADLDAFLIDCDFDDSLDCHLFEIRESLADDRNF